MSDNSSQSSNEDIDYIPSEPLPDYEEIQAPEYKYTQMHSEVQFGFTNINYEQVQRLHQQLLENKEKFAITVQKKVDLNITPAQKRLDDIQILKDIHDDIVQITQNMNKINQTIEKTQVGYIQKQILLKEKKYKINQMKQKAEFLKEMQRQKKTKKQDKNMMDLNNDESTLDQTVNSSLNKSSMLKSETDVPLFKSQKERIVNIQSNVINNINGLQISQKLMRNLAMKDQMNEKILSSFLTIIDMGMALNEELNKKLIKQMIEKTQHMK